MYFSADLWIPYASFFIISGILNSRSFYRNKSVLQFIISDLRRLIIPYYLCSFVYIGLSVLAHLIEWKTILPERSWAIITGRGVAPIWFLAAIFLTKTVINFIYPALNNTIWRKIIIIFLVVLSCLLSFFLSSRH